MLLALITALVAPPVAVALAIVREGFAASERVVLTWGGLRGAVPMILATFAVIEGVPRSIAMLNIVFFAVLLSATVRGTTVQQLAARIRRREQALRPPMRPDGDEPDEDRSPQQREPRALIGAEASAHLLREG